MAASEFAVARPRSLWQCVLKTARCALGTRDEHGGEERLDLVWRRVPHRVGQVDRRRPGVDHVFDDAAQEVDVAARRVLRGELHIVRVVAGQADGSDRRVVARLARHVELALEVQVRRGDERVNARPGGGSQGAAGPLDVARARPGQTGDDRTPHGARHRLDGLGIGLGRDREPGLDEIDAQAVQLLARVAPFRGSASSSPAPVPRRAAWCRRSSADQPP